MLIFSASGPHPFSVLLPALLKWERQDLLHLKQPSNGDDACYCGEPEGCHDGSCSFVQGGCAEIRTKAHNVKHPSYNNNSKLYTAPFINKMWLKLLYIQYVINQEIKLLVLYQIEISLLNYLLSIPWISTDKISIIQRLLTEMTANLL